MLSMLDYIALIYPAGTAVARPAREGGTAVAATYAGYGLTGLIAAGITVVGLRLLLSPDQAAVLLAAGALLLS